MTLESDPPDQPRAEGGREKSAPAASLRGRLKQLAGRHGTLAERRGRLKQASDSFRAWAGRLRRRP